MAFSWTKTKITDQNGVEREAIAPIIISASRATDIPAFYSQWLLNRLESGYVKWNNPFNPNQAQYVSFAQTRLFVFWTKNPQPLIAHLPFFDKQNLHYYFHFTVNDYEKEGFEPNVPPLTERLDTFKRLSEQIGKEKTIWRMSPFLPAENLPVDELLARTERIGNELINYTDKLAFSFSDIFKYRNVKNNLMKDSSYYNENNIHFSEFTPEQKEYMARELVKLAEKWREKNPDFQLGACGEEMDLTPYNIPRNKCIDDDLIIRLFPDDHKLMDFIGYKLDLFSTDNIHRTKTYKELKDKNQRPVCGCIYSKDIGSYNTCPHYCIYCYANRSRSLVEKNRADITGDGEAIK